MSIQQLSDNRVESQLFASDDLGKLVLIVDDNQAMLEMLDLFLTDAGYAVKQALSADKALKELMKGNVFLLLTDLHLPTLNGWDLASLARVYNPQIKVIVLTGYGTFAKPPRLGLVDLILGKPITAKLLLQNIDMLSVSVRSD